MPASVLFWNGKQSKICFNSSIQKITDIHFKERNKVQKSRSET